MSQKKPPWTAEEIAELRRLRAEGVPIAMIGHQIGRTFAAVKGMLLRLQDPEPRTRPPKYYNDTETAALVELIQAGKTYREIAEALRLSMSQVRDKTYRLRQKMGGPENTNPEKYSSRQKIVKRQPQQPWLEGVPQIPDELRLTPCHMLTDEDRAVIGAVVRAAMKVIRRNKPVEDPTLAKY